MPNIAAILREEIARVARKEVRAQTELLKKVSAGYRSEIIALKRRIQTMEKALRQKSKAAPKSVPTLTEAADGSAAHRFSGKGLASHRKRLGLSAHDCGLLVGASAQSLYNWEAGSARPRARHMEAIAALRSMGKREVAARLEAIR